MPILKLTGGKTLSVSQAKAEEIIRWKTGRSEETSKLVDVGGDNFLAMSEIKGVLSDGEHIRGKQDRIDLDSHDGRERVKEFERELGGLSLYEWGLKKGIILDRRKKINGHVIMDYAVNIDRHGEWTECRALWSALQDLRIRRQMAAQAAAQTEQLKIS